MSTAATGAGTRRTPLPPAPAPRPAYPVPDREMSLLPADEEDPTNTTAMDRTFARPTPVQASAPVPPMPPLARPLVRTRHPRPLSQGRHAADNDQHAMYTSDARYHHPAGRMSKREVALADSSKLPVSMINSATAKTSAVTRTASRDHTVLFKSNVASNGTLATRQRPSATARPHFAPVPLPPLLDSEAAVVRPKVPSARRRVDASAAAMVVATDPRRIVDHGLKDRLAMARLVQQQHQQQQHGYVAASDWAVPPSLNSTRFIGRELTRWQDAQLNVERTLAGPTADELITRACKKAARATLNTATSAPPVYQYLQPIDVRSRRQGDGGTEPPPLPLTVQRARKAVDSRWRKSLGNRPKLLELYVIYVCVCA